VTRSGAHAAVALTALMAIVLTTAGCQQALVCDVSIFSLGEDPIAAGDALPAGAQLLANAGEFDAAQASIGPTELGTEIKLQLKPDAAERLRQFTGANLGTYLAVTLNGVVMAVPVIQDEVGGGALSITLPSTDRDGIDAFGKCIGRRALPEP
jgi:preprotein translocase subunit SecD